MDSKEVKFKWKTKEEAERDEYKLFDDIENDSKIFFHGTSGYCAQRIMAEGFKPKEGDAGFYFLL